MNKHVSHTNEKELIHTMQQSRKKRSLSENILRVSVVSDAINASVPKASSSKQNKECNVKEPFKPANHIAKRDVDEVQTTSPHLCKVC